MLTTLERIESVKQILDSCMMELAILGEDVVKLQIKANTQKTKKQQKSKKRGH